MQKCNFYEKKAICESGANVQMWLGHKAARKEGLDTNAHRCRVQVVQKKKAQSLTAPPKLCNSPKTAASQGEKKV